jgi:hypothetical protein
VTAWAIYWSPAGSPAAFLVQRWEGEPGKRPRSEPPTFAATLALAREVVPKGLERHPPSGNDQESPLLIETWEAPKS